MQDLLYMQIHFHEKKPKTSPWWEFLKKFGESEGMFSISHNDSVCSQINLKIKMEI